MKKTAENKNINDIFLDIAHSFEGDEEGVRYFLNPYVRHFKGCNNVLDLGCGRGYFLDLLKESGIKGTGIDLDPASVKTCKEKGHIAINTDVLDYVSGKNRFDGIFCSHIIEHLSGKDCITFLHNCSKSLSDNGILVIITPNFSSGIVRDEIFWLDITHVRPYPYKLLKQIFEKLGLSVIDCGIEDNKLNTFIAGRKKGLKCPSAQITKDKIGIIWNAPIHDPSGYADEARNFVLSLDKAGITTRVAPVKWSNKEAKLTETVSAKIKELTKTTLSPGFIHVMHIFPPHFQRIPEARFNIGRTMFETDRIPENWVTKCNEMDEIWVPTDFNMKTFSYAGVRPEKLFKIPGPHDFSGYHPDVSPLPIEDKKGFSFLSVFDWTLRKGWDILIKAFIEEFKKDEDITLILKVWSSYGKSVAQLQQELEEYIRVKLSTDPSHIPDILFLDFNIAVEDMPNLYKAVNAYVMPSRGEGWGRPYMEAMAMGLPTIGTGWSGHTEFMSDENSFLIDYEIVDVPEAGWREITTYKDHRWAEPSAAHLRTLMRYVYENRDEAKEKGNYARKDVIQRFDRAVIAEQIVRHIDNISENRHINQNKSLPPSDKTRISVCWEGSQFVYHSLALINREVEIELLKRDQVELTIAPYETHQFDEGQDGRYPALKERFLKKLNKVDVHVRHQWPPNFNPPSEGHWVLIQPWEFGSLPKVWVDPINNLVDEVWIPSNYVRQVYIDSGIYPAKVHVVPNGINPDIFRPNGTEMKLHARKGFKFLFVGGTIYRKGIDILLETYLNTFTAKDDVVLVIKDLGSKSFYAGQNLSCQIREIKKNPKAPAIYYLEKDLSEIEIASLYRSCDCLVHPYRGEGFGLPVLEAMACGLPVIVTAGGSTDDFVDDNTGYKILSSRVIFGDRNIGGLETVGDTWFLEIDRNALAEKMRYVTTHTDETKRIGYRASQKVLKEFTWQKAAEKYIERMNKLNNTLLKR